MTVNAAEMLGWQDKIGAVEPGKFADLVAVTGDPVTDITGSATGGTAGSPTARIVTDLSHASSVPF